MIKISNIGNYINLFLPLRKGVWLCLLALALAACSETEFQGDEATLTQTDSVPIFLSMANNSTTRAPKSLATYEGTMKVYAAKKFDAETYYTKAINQYALWNTSNDPAIAGNWEYVGSKNDKKTVITNGTAGTADNFTVPQNQVLKFWDYKASHYMFWAVAPYSGTTFGVRNPADHPTDSKSNSVIWSQFDNIDGHLTATTTATTYKKFYISNPIRVDKANYGTYTVNNPVVFSFKEMHSKVRVAFYETIPHYKIVDIKFYDNQSTPLTGKNIVFNREAECFVGGKSGTETPYVRCTYDNTNLTYSFAYKNMNVQKWIQFGKLELSSESPMEDGSASGQPSWGTDADMDVTKYFTVLPTPSSLVSSTAPITMKMDFTIQAENTTADTSAETIEVKGVTATVPLSFSTWQPNHAYSYIFKITKESLNLKVIEFDAEASSIFDYSTEHEEEMK